MLSEQKDINTLHFPVMKEEVIQSLNLFPGLTVVDATVNRAGHAEEIAKRIGPTGILIIFDLDKKALDFATQKLESLENHPTIIPIHSNYRHIAKYVSKLSPLPSGGCSVDRIFADLGLSSQELEISGRGFSFQKDEPLHMTFQSEINNQTFTAMDLLNNLSVSNLEKIFKVYGDVKNSWKIANAIVEKREELLDKNNNKYNQNKIHSTKQLVEIIESVSPRVSKVHPATKVFQAIRIAVNDEFESIKEFIKDGYELLNDGGILAIISFHSGEDRIVKTMFKNLETKENKQQKLKPSRKEILLNKRSRSALLRIIKK